MKKISIVIILMLGFTLETTAQYYADVDSVADSGSNYVRSSNSKSRIGSSRRNSHSSSQKKSCPNNNHPHWIDLGLPSGTKWRCCNEGASKPEDYGGYYEFGTVSSVPTRTQIEELCKNCTYTWTTQNGVYGGKFTGPNGGTIFLPAAGIRWNSGLDWAGSSGYYWSSTLFENYPGNAYGLGFYSGDAYWSNFVSHGGQSVRPVR